MKDKKKVSEGKRFRAAGNRFELKVRKDLEETNWTVCKWGNIIDFEKDCIIKCKAKFNPFTKSMIMISGGMPDFLCMRRLTRKEILKNLKNEI